MVSESSDKISPDPKVAHAIEARSIDYVPRSERRGKASDLGAIWFVGNINLTAMARPCTRLRIEMPLQ